MMGDGLHTGQDTSTAQAVGDGALAVDAISSLREIPKDPILPIGQLTDSTRNPAGGGQMKATRISSWHQSLGAE